MVKRRLLKLLFMIFILCAVPKDVLTSNAAEVEGIIDFEAPVKEGYVSDGIISGYFQVEMWHHSGNEWAITFPEATTLTGSTTNRDKSKTILLKDADAGEN